MVRKTNDKDIIGLLICKEKNDLDAQWTVDNSPVPIAFSEYILDNIIPNEIDGVGR